MTWVLKAWDDVPVDLLQRGMETLILQSALAPLPPPLTTLPRPPVPASAPVLVGASVDAALALLDTLKAHDAQPVDLPDENGSSDSSDSEAGPRPDGQMPSVPLEDTTCMRCERPVRPKNSARCHKCRAWYHVGCLGEPGACMLCC